MIILAVDDEKHALEVLTDAIEVCMPDAEILGFSNGSAALEFAKSRACDVAFLDIRLRDMSGLMLAKALKDSCPNTNIVFVTAYSEYAMGRRIAFINRVSDYWNLGISIGMDDMIVDSSAGGPGYNVPDPKTREYIYLMAREEGIILDPCYTAKAFGGIVEMSKDGRLPGGSNVLLIHTGGTPGIFAQEHVDAMQEELWDGEKTIFRLQE